MLLRSVTPPLHRRGAAALDAEDAVRLSGLVPIVQVAVNEPAARSTSDASSIDSPIVQALCLSARSEWAAVPANVPSDGGGLGGRSTIEYSIGQVVLRIGAPIRRREAGARGPRAPERRMPICTCTRLSYVDRYVHRGKSVR